jgi:hypothetical protein
VLEAACTVLEAACTVSEAACTVSEAACTVSERARGQCRRDHDSLERVWTFRCRRLVSRRTDSDDVRLEENPTRHNRRYAS